MFRTTSRRVVAIAQGMHECVRGFVFDRNLETIDQPLIIGGLYSMRHHPEFVIIRLRNLDAPAGIVFRICKDNFCTHGRIVYTVIIVEGHCTFKLQMIVVMHFILGICSGAGKKRNSPANHFTAFMDIALSQGAIPYWGTAHKKSNTQISFTFFAAGAGLKPPS